MNATPNSDTFTASGPLDLLRWIGDSSRAGSVTLSRAAAAVLEALVLTVDNKTLQWPRPGAASWEGISVARLGERAHYSGRTVARVLPELEQLGVLEVIPRDGRPHVFRLALARITALWGTAPKGAPAPARPTVEPIEPPLVRRRVVASSSDLVDAVAQALCAHGVNAATSSLLGFLRGGGARFDGLRRHVGGLTANVVEAVRAQAAELAEALPRVAPRAPQPPRQTIDELRAEAVHRLVAARERVKAEIAAIDAALPGFTLLPTARWVSLAPEFKDAYLAKVRQFNQRVTLARWLEDTASLAADAGPEALARIRAALVSASDLKLSSAV